MTNKESSPSRFLPDYLLTQTNISENSMPDYCVTVSVHLLNNYLTFI